jgi:hypothetical protein
VFRILKVQYLKILSISKVIASLMDERIARTNDNVPWRKITFSQQEGSRKKERSEERKKERKKERKA